MDNWVSFYVELKWSEKEVFNDFMEKLLKYNVGKYVVGKEVEETSHKETGGEHIHICCQMSEEEYHRFAVTVLRQKMKLRGRAIAGFCRQYGKVKHIRSLEKMKAYTMKDGNIVTNLDEEELIKLKAQSYKKENHITEFWKMVDYVNDNMKSHTDGYINDIDEGKARRLVVEYMIINNDKEHNLKTPTRSQIDNVVKSYVMYRSGLTQDEKVNWIINYLYG